MSTRTLILEKDMHLMKGLDKMLRTEGYRVMLSSSPENAKSVCRALSPAAGIVDISQWGDDGLCFCRWFRQSAGGGRKLVLVTPPLEGSALREGLNLGADAWLKKPFQPDHLRRILARLAPCREAPLDDGAVKRLPEAEAVREAFQRDWSLSHMTLLQATFDTPALSAFVKAAGREGWLAMMTHFMREMPRHLRILSFEIVVGWDRSRSFMVMTPESIGPAVQAEVDHVLDLSVAMASIRASNPGADSAPAVRPLLRSAVPFFRWLDLSGRNGRPFQDHDLVRLGGFRSGTDGR